MEKKPDWKEKFQKLKETLGMDKILLLLLAGVLLLLSAGSFEGKKDEKENISQNNGALAEDAGKATVGAGETDTSSYEAMLERRLEEVLMEVEGLGEVRVMITLKNNGERVLQSDSTSSQSDTMEQDSGGGTRSIRESGESKTTVVVSDGTADSPYVTRETMPEVEGVLVVAQGAGDSTVKQSIYEAVQALFGVPAHKIKVLRGVMEK